MNITPWTMWKEVSKRRIDAFYFDESFKAQTWHTVGTTFLRHTMIFAYVEWKQCLTKRNGRKVDDNLASGTKRFRVDIKRGSYSINNNPFSPWIAKIKDNPEETNQIEANWATLNNTLWSNWPIQPGWKSILLEKFLLVSTRNCSRQESKFDLILIFLFYGYKKKEGFWKLISVT